MNDILMTNIFFAITAISSIVLTILVSIVLINIIKFTKKIQDISTAVGDQTLKVIEDVEEVRHAVRSHVTTIKTVASAAFVKKIVEKIFNKK